MKKDTDCTEILVGKAASMDGSTIVARNEDGYGPINPIKFIVHEAHDQTNASYTSVTTGVTVPLPDHAYRYTATPQADQSDGQYEEAGINELNVGMSATETTATNARVLGYDPLVHDGVDEEAMVTLVLPYIKSAKEGVQRLGALIENTELVKATVSPLTITTISGCSKPLVVTIGGSSDARRHLRNCSQPNRGARDGSQRYRQFPRCQ